MTNQAIEDRLTDLLSEAEEDFSEVEEFIDNHEEEYEGDLKEFAFRKAVQYGNYDYVSDHVDEVELNDEDGYSSYLYETDDENIQELLMSSGAFKNMEDYADCRFAIETINWSILAFDPDFQREVFESYLENYDLTREQVIAYLEYGEAPVDEDFDRDIADDMDILGISAENGELKYADLEGQCAPGITDLLEELGYECEFEGESWKLETSGVYFID